MMSEINNARESGGESGDSAEKNDSRVYDWYEGLSDQERQRIDDEGKTVEEAFQREQLIQSGIAEKLVAARKRFVKVTTNDNPNVESMFTHEDFEFTLRRHHSEIRVDVMPRKAAGDLMRMSSCFYIGTTGMISLQFQFAGKLTEEQMLVLERLV